MWSPVVSVLLGQSGQFGTHLPQPCRNGLVVSASGPAEGDDGV
jgi:hypothetical protein